MRALARVRRVGKGQKCVRKVSDKCYECRGLEKG